MEPIMLNELIADFGRTLNVEWQPPTDLREAAQRVINGCPVGSVLDQQTRCTRLLGLVNAKFRLNKDRAQALIDAAALHRIWLNYHDKLALLECFDHADAEQYHNWRGQRWNDESLDALFDPIKPSDTLAALHDQFAAPVIKRSDAKDSSPAERREQILRALFGGLVFVSFPEYVVHAHFNLESRRHYYPSYYDHLRRFHPQVLSRECALLVLGVDERLTGHMSLEVLRDSLCAFIRDSYDRLSNHCYLAIVIRPFSVNGEDGQWSLFSDLVLYAEKHRFVEVKTGYFRPDRIRDATSAQIPRLDIEACEFHLANEGFFFRDCFVLPQGTGKQGVTTSSASCDLLLLFEKNDRDETLVPCPACRSHDVTGNSYPTLGVKSWECLNPICPERSAFDRGNRYSVSSLIKQEAIKSDADQIPESSLRRWKLDIVPAADASAVAEMLVRHFSLSGDRLVFVNWFSADVPALGRSITQEDFDPIPRADGVFNAFQESPLFKRFVVERDKPAHSTAQTKWEPLPDTEVFNGDCFEVLAGMPADCIDGAVTSPPYYNARTYTQWPNIYCYLYDMYNSAAQLFRVLKPGGVYMFNIFDYFDNENTMALSSMGKKRMILGPYIINVFRRIGFRLLHNTVWYKGEIEGKRNFNQGNRSPYYQFPFNCWEHVLVFEKPGPTQCTLRFPTVLDARPVVKMVRGKNILGHSAPFPREVPDLLLSQLQPGARVLDPFAGSMTTGRAAHSAGLASVSIELHREYCELGIRLLEQETMPLLLFGNAAISI